MRVYLDYFSLQTDISREGSLVRHPGRYVRHERGPPAGKNHPQFLFGVGVQARIQDFLQGGGGSTTAVYAAGALGARAEGGLGLINIRLRCIASIEYSKRFFFFFLL